MNHLFADALKAKMSGLDYPRVHRADGHLVKFAAVDAKKFWSAGAPPSVLRTDLSHGCPFGVKVCCSQSSRSKR